MNSVIDKVLKEIRISNEVTREELESNREELSAVVIDYLIDIASRREVSDKFQWRGNLISVPDFIQGTKFRRDVETCMFKCVTAHSEGSPIYITAYELAEYVVNYGNRGGVMGEGTTGLQMRYSFLVRPERTQVSFACSDKLVGIMRPETLVNVYETGSGVIAETYYRDTEGFYVAVETELTDDMYEAYNYLIRGTGCEVSPVV